MKKIAIILSITIFVSACANGMSKEAADQALERENQLWRNMGEMAINECPKEVSRKIQLKRQACLEKLINEQVRPYVLYPELVDYMLTRTKAEAQDYAAGKINKDTYVSNVNAVTRDYWDHWDRVTYPQIAETGAGYEGIGDALLVGIQSYSKTLQNRREEAERNRPIRCVTYGYTTTCNQY